MKISAIEKLLNLSRETVRYYEKEGLISPKQYDNRYREYEEGDIRQLKTILVLRRAGIGISDIRNLFEGDLQLGEAVDLNISELYEKRREIDRAIELSNELSGHELSDIDADYYFERFCSSSE